MCGQLTIRCLGEPAKVSICHCLDCQRRSGSAFAAQARYEKKAVEISGRASIWSAIGPSGERSSFFSCADCASGGWFINGGQPELVAVPLGTFDDPSFPAPSFSVYASRKRSWVSITGPDTAHYD